MLGVCEGHSSMVIRKSGDPMKNKKLLKQVGVALLIIVAGMFYFMNEVRHSTGMKDSIQFLTQDENVDKEVTAQELEGVSQVTPDYAPDENQEKDTKEERIYIHVCGAVNAPGVYELSKDSRVYEAVILAGGFLDTAATDVINQAQILMDGVKLYIPTVAEVKASKPQQESYITSSIEQFSSSSESKSKSEGKININTADKETLMTLQGIGESKAQSIITYREEYGGFEKISDLQKISGIKEAVYSKIKDHITVSN